MSESEEALVALIETLQTAEIRVRVIKEVMEEERLGLVTTLDSRVQAAKTEAESLLTQARALNQRAG